MRIPCLFSVLLFFGSAVPLDGVAQDKGGPKEKERIRLVHANSLEFDRSHKVKAQRLIGDVRLKHGDVTMDCDSAYLYSGGKRLDAYGNVHVVQNDSIHLYGDSLKYDGSSRKANLWGNIRLRDPEMTLTTDTLFYEIPTKAARYIGGGTIRSKKNDHTLTSRTGIYHSDSKLFYFKKDVILEHPEYDLFSDTLKYNTATEIADFLGPTVIRPGKDVIYCERGWYDTRNDLSVFRKNAYLYSEGRKLEGDSIRYDRKAHIGKALGNVVITDTANHLRSLGGEGIFYEERNEAVLYKEPVLIRGGSEDSLFLRADTIRSHMDSITEETSMRAYNNVRFYQHSLQGKCDSLTYTSSDSTLRLFHEPVLWSGAHRITGDTVLIRTYEGRISNVHIPAAAFMSSQKDTNKFDQIKGRTLTAFFDSTNSLDRILVKGNGQTLYFPEKGEADTSEIIGMNKVECSDILIRLEDEEISTISFLEKPAAVLYPLKDLGSVSTELKGFQKEVTGRPANEREILGRWKDPGRGMKREKEGNSE